MIAGYDELDTGQVGLYVGTRADSLVQALSVVGSELSRFRSEPATPDELTRAKENLKGRVVLALESTSARMNRLGSETLAGLSVVSTVRWRGVAGQFQTLTAEERLSDRRDVNRRVRELFFDLQNALERVVKQGDDLRIELRPRGGRDRVNRVLHRPRNFVGPDRGKRVEDVDEAA